MTETQRFDPAAFKDGIRREWRAAAPGWRKWYATTEADAAGQVVSRKLVELAALKPGQAVLDVGAGYGEPGLTAARAVSPGGRIVLQDISSGMLDFARERAANAGLENIEFVECDAEELELEPASLDAIVSRAAIMYFADVVGTLRRLRSYLAPGGRLAAAVWGPADKVGFAAPVPVILETLGLEPPPPDRPGPFSLGDRDKLASVVSEAGFDNLELDTVTAVYELESPEAATRWIRDIAPPITDLVDGHPPDAQEQAWGRVTEAWTPFVGSDGRVRLPCEANVIAAVNTR